jgi:hypothetical protein
MWIQPEFAELLEMSGQLIVEAVAVQEPWGVVQVPPALTA